jgi:hypothetical protein
MLPAYRGEQRHCLGHRWLAGSGRCFGRRRRLGWRRGWNAGAVRWARGSSGCTRSRGCATARTYDTGARVSLTGRACAGAGCAGRGRASRWCCGVCRRTEWPQLHGRAARLQQRWLGLQRSARRLRGSGQTSNSNARPCVAGCRGDRSAPHATAHAARMTRTP